MTWQVFDGDQLVLDVSPQPGAIRSKARLREPATSTFMSATSHDADHEDRFHHMLVASSSVDEFLAQVRAAGLTVR